MSYPTLPSVPYVLRGQGPWYIAYAFILCMPFAHPYALPLPNSLFPGISSVPIPEPVYAPAPNPVSAPRAFVDVLTCFPDTYPCTRSTHSYTCSPRPPFVHPNAHPCTLTRIHLHTHTYAPAHALVCTCTLTRMHLHTHSYTPAHSLVCTCTLTRMHQHPHSYAPAHSLTRSCQEAISGSQSCSSSSGLPAIACSIKRKTLVAYEDHKWL